MGTFQHERRQLLVEDVQTVLSAFTPLGFLEGRWDNSPRLPIEDGQFNATYSTEQKWSTVTVNLPEGLLQRDDFAVVTSLGEFEPDMPRPVTSKLHDSMNVQQNIAVRVGGNGYIDRIHWNLSLTELSAGHVSSSISESRPDVDIHITLGEQPGFCIGIIPSRPVRSADIRIHQTVLGSLQDIDVQIQDGRIFVRGYELDFTMLSSENVSDVSVVYDIFASVFGVRLRQDIEPERYIDALIQHAKLQLRDPVT